MKLLSRVILQVNGAIDAMNKEGAGGHNAKQEKVTPPHHLEISFLKKGGGGSLSPPIHPAPPLPYVRYAF